MDVHVWKQQKNELPATIQQNQGTYSFCASVKRLAAGSNNWCRRLCLAYRVQFETGEEDPPPDIAVYNISRSYWITPSCRFDIAKWTTATITDRVNVTVTPGMMIIKCNRPKSARSSIQGNSTGKTEAELTDGSTARTWKNRCRRACAKRRYLNKALNHILHTQISTHDFSGPWKIHSDAIEHEEW